MTQEQTPIPIKQSHIVETVRLIKEGQYKQVYLKIAPNGTIEGSWFFGCSDFVLTNDSIILFRTDQQTEETLIYTITMIIRNREGYQLVNDEKGDTV